MNDVAVMSAIVLTYVMWFLVRESLQMPELDGERAAAIATNVRSSV